MAMGADFLIKALLGAIGLEPEKAQKQLLELQQWNVNSIKSFNARLIAQEANTRAIARKLDLIIYHLGIDDGRYDEQPAIAGTESAIAGTESAERADANQHGD